MGVYSINENELVYPMKAKTKIDAQKQIYSMASNILTMIDPEYAADGHWVVQIHAMDSESKVNKHIDTHDITFQYGITIGNFQGGCVITWDSSGNNPIKHEVRNKVIKLDGRLFHQVTPVTSGIRYSMYFYKVYDPLIRLERQLFEPATIIYNN